MDVTQLKSSDTFRVVTQPLAIFASLFDKSHFTSRQQLQKQLEHFIFGKGNIISEMRLFAKFYCLGKLEGGMDQKNLNETTGMIINALKIVLNTDDGGEAPV